MSVPGASSRTGESIDSAQIYMNDIRRDAELIDSDREVELALEIRAAVEAQEILQAVDSDPDLELTSFTDLSREDLEQTLQRGYKAKKDFIKANLRLVVSIAKAFARSPVHMIDLIQNGNIALIGAVDKFDPDLGNKFSTFAYARIYSSMQRAEADQGRTIHITVDQLKKIKSYRRIYEEVKSKNSSLDEIGIRGICADKLQLSVEELYDLEMDEYMLKLPASLDVQVGEHGTATLGSILGGEDMSLAARQNTDIPFNDLTSGLTPREIRVIELRYVDDMPFSKIGELLGIKRQAVQQIEAGAMYKIRCRILEGDVLVDLSERPGLVGVVEKEKARRAALVKPKPIDHPWLDC